MPPSAPIVDALAALLRRQPRIVLAVSGGVDSMVLLDAAVRARAVHGDLDATELVVASFDHRTGPHSAEALELVSRVATGHATPLVTGDAGDAGDARQGASEAAWRAARWHFLRGVARRFDAVVATAHTRDDQVETVVMRVLRDTGARGLAGLYAPSAIMRPLLSFTRQELLAYAARHALEWVEDPSNARRRHFRNRVRLDLLPALQRARPAFSEELLALAREAAELRRHADAVARSLVGGDAAGPAVVSRELFRALPETAHPLLWQSVAAMSGVTLDWRGTRRLARSALDLPVGGRIPLSGGFELLSRRAGFEFRPSPPVPPSLPPAAMPLRLQGETIYGAWRFSRVTDATINGGEDGAFDGEPWFAWLPADERLVVRGWQGGDRVILEDGVRRRRVKRFFSDRHVESADREGWPVIVAGEEIIWIPGIRRTRAATARSGRPGVCILCERLHR